MPLMMLVLAIEVCSTMYTVQGTAGGGHDVGFLVWWGWGLLVIGGKAWSKEREIGKRKFCVDSLEIFFAPTKARLYV